MAKSGGSGAKKYGRMHDWCAKYKSEGRREKNKARKAAKLARQMQKKREKRERRDRDRERKGEIGYVLHN